MTWDRLERETAESAAGRLIRASASGLLVFGLAWLSYRITPGHTHSTPLWPANAVVVAILISRKPIHWPVYVAAGFLGLLAAESLSWVPMAHTLALALLNLGEILTCSALVRWLCGGELKLSRPGHLFIFAVVAAMASTANTLAALGAFNLFGRVDFLQVLWGRTIAHLLGLLIVTPALLSLHPVVVAQFFRRATWRRNLALLILLAAVCAVDFSHPEYQIRFLVLAVLILLAILGETVGAALGVLLVGLVAVAMAALGYGSALASPQVLGDGAVIFEIFLLVCVATALPVAAVIERRRQLEDTLAARAREFQLLADHSTDLILRVGRDFRILYASPSCRRFGYEPEDLVGAVGYDLFHPDEFEDLRRLGEMLFSGAPLDPGAQLQYHLRTAKGDWVWVEGAPQVVREADGRPIEVITQLRDINARKAAEEALAESEAKYRLLADRSTDMIMQVDAQAVIRYVSPACRQLGYEPEEMIGRAVFEFAHPDEPVSRVDWAETERIAQLGGRRERRFRCKDGGYVWLEGRRSILRDPDGQVSGAVTNLRDVTERRALEQALDAKRIEAEAAAVAKTEFLANMSHEIRTPLTAVTGFAGLLEAMDSLSDRARNYVERIVTGGQALLAIVNDILDFSKMEAGQIELDPHAFEPASFVADTLQLAKTQAEAKHLQLKMTLEGAVPPWVRADSSRLRQVLLNLLTNAIKFTDQGAVEVRLAYQAELGRLKLAVSDTGAGIPPGQLERLFQRFTQADGSISRRFGGTGLGLAICKNLVELMNGEIGAESALGAGSTFWFTVAAPMTETMLGLRPSAEPDIGPAQPVRILVVDDVEANRELVCTILSVFGHALTQACNGSEAVEAAIRAPFDLVLMDLQMPGMDGLAATRAIRATSNFNSDTPIIALSANVMQTHLEACREAGMDDHVGKPIDPAELLTKVACWTATSETRGAASLA